MIDWFIFLSNIMNFYQLQKYLQRKNHTALLGYKLHMNFKNQGVYIIQVGLLVKKSSSMNITPRSATLSFTF